MNRFATLAAAVALSGAVAGAANAQEYPFRDITNAVVWGAGGGTDTINRMVMAEMEKFLPVGISVINQTGGVAGSNGMVYVLNQPDDGYTLAGISESNVTASVQGGWDKRMDVWYPFIVGGSPLMLAVPASSSYESLEALVDAAKAAPETIPAAASGSGSIHHLNLLALENGTEAKFRFVPYQGSAPAMEAAVNGEVAMVIGSLAELYPLVEGGKLKPLAMLRGESAMVAGTDVRDALSIYPALERYLPLSQSIGFAVLNSAPDTVKTVLSDAFVQAMDSETVKTWAATNHYEISGLHGEAASAAYAKLESVFGWTLWDLGAATVNPETLGIPKP